MKLLPCAALCYNDSCLYVFSVAMATVGHSAYNELKELFMILYHRYDICKVFFQCLTLYQIGSFMFHSFYSANVYKN